MEEVNFESDLNLNLALIEQEHFIGRLKVLDHLEKLSNFLNDNSQSVDERISRALDYFPNNFREAALGLFASTIYITKAMFDQAWLFLYDDLCKKIGEEISFSNSAIIELDKDQVRDDFYRIVSMEGRLEDNGPIRSIDDLIDYLIQVESGTISKQSSKALKTFLTKKYWLILVDQSLSGTSLVSELKKAEYMIETLSINEKPKLVTIVQLVTEQATEKFKEFNFDILHAIKIPYECALNHSRYSIFKDAEFKKKLKELCSWFYSSNILNSGDRLVELARENHDIGLYGFGGMGWSIITYRNAPNNALPILWFQSPNEKYTPPFKRIDSRTGNEKPWLGRKEWLKKFKNNTLLRKKIYTYIKNLE